VLYQLSYLARQASVPRGERRRLRRLGRPTRDREDHVGPTVVVDHALGEHACGDPEGIPRHRLARVGQA
jgi:hypothetical protein